MSLSPSILDSKMPQKYLDLLLVGDRSAAKTMIETAVAGGASAAMMLNDLVWPTMELIQALYKEDRITQMQLNLATRLNRQITDQLAAKLEISEPNDRKVLIFCGDAEPEELGGQIAADMFEAAGYTVRFGGGGVANDEILKMVGDFRPDLLVMFATLPSGVPGVRKLIDYLRDVNSCPNMQTMCCGGIYKRAEGLAEEIGADLYAADAATAVEIAGNQQERKANLDQQTVGRSRRMKKAAIRRGDRDESIAEAA